MTGEFIHILFFFVGYAIGFLLVVGFNLLARYIKDRIRARNEFLAEANYKWNHPHG